MLPDLVTKEKSIIRKYLLVGIFTLLLLVVGVGGWSTLASVHGAVVAFGTVMQEGHNKHIQHSEGGIIKKIHVKEGQKVKKGDILISLDHTRVRADLEIVRNQLMEQKIKRFRLVAQRDHLSSSTLNENLHNKMGNSVSMQSVISVQKRLFNTALKRIQKQKKHINDRVAQQEKAIAGYMAQIAAKNNALNLLKKEGSSLKRLRLKRLVSLQRLNPILREESEIESDIGGLKASIATSRSRIIESHLEVIELDETFQNTTLKDLEKAESDILELQERSITARDRMERLEIRVPQNGNVHELQNISVDGVVTPGETLMLIVPDSQQLVIETKISPTSMDQITIGQQVTVRFPAFNQRTTPTLKGRTAFLAPDQSKNDKTGEAYFTVRVSIQPEEVQKLGKNKIAVGMPAEVMIRTTDRTVISFLLKPLADQFNRAFREQ